MRYPTERNQEPNDGHRCSQPPSPHGRPATSTDAADVEIVGGGTVFLFLLHTAKARHWVDTFVSSDRQMFGGGLVVEHRWVVALVDEMQRDGLLLARGGRW